MEFFREFSTNFVCNWLKRRHLETYFNHKVNLHKTRYCRISVCEPYMKNLHWSKLFKMSMSILGEVY